MTTTKHDTLIVGLHIAYALEGQAISTLENVHSRLEHYPELSPVWRSTSRKHAASNR